MDIFPVTILFFLFSFFPHTLGLLEEEDRRILLSHLGPSILVLRVKLSPGVKNNKERNSIMTDQPVGFIFRSLTCATSSLLILVKSLAWSEPIVLLHHLQVLMPIIAQVSMIAQVSPSQVAGA